MPEKTVPGENAKPEMLHGIHDPKDLRPLTYEQLRELAGEIREFLVNHVAVTGGHLGPNLGVVELTLGIHMPRSERPSAVTSSLARTVPRPGHQLTGASDT